MLRIGVSASLPTRSTVLPKADYTLIDFEADPTAIAELDRVLHIMDAVQRYMITRRNGETTSVGERVRRCLGAQLKGTIKHEHQQGNDFRQSHT